MNHWIFLLIIGVFFVVAGITALLNPFAATITAELIAGWAFIVIGLLQIIAAISTKGWGGKIWTLILGAVALFIGFNLLESPLEGTIALTVILGAMFLVSGVFKVIAGFTIHDSGLKWVIILTGAVSAVLGFMVLSNLGESMGILLGVLLAVELLSCGIASISLALSRKAENAALSV